MAEPFNRYDLTSARQHGRPGREIRPRSLTVDIHSHALVPAAADVVRGHLTPDPRAEFYSEETRILGRKQDADRTPFLTDLERRMRTFDEMGVDAQVITPAPNQCYYGVPREIGLKAARVVNEGIAEIARSRPDRIPAAMGSVPLQAGGEAAADELEYCVTTLGLKGVEVLAHVRDKELSDPTFEPFWAKVEELGAVVFIHPNSFTQPQRFGKHYFSNVIGNPTESAIAASHLIFGEVLDRCPKLVVCLPHGGGSFPYLVGRINHGWGVRPECKHLLKGPNDYLRRFYYDTVTHSAPALSYLIGLVGADRVMLGSDFCFDMGYTRPVEVVTGHAGIGDDDRRKILGGNAARLLHL